MVRKNSKSTRSLYINELFCFFMIIELIVKLDVTLGPYYYRETNPEPGQGN